MAAPDTTDPTLISASLPAVDVSNGGETVTFSASALDSGSGVDKVIIYFDHAWQGTSGAVSTVTLSDAADSFADGSSAASVYIDPATPAGPYAITSVIVYDKAGNCTAYSPEQLAGLGIATSFNVNGNTPADTSAPTLSSANLPAVDVTGGSDVVTFSAGALDTGSGVDRITLFFDHSWQGTSGAQSSVVLSDATDSFGDGSSATSVYFDPASGAGTYSLTSVVVTDKAGNSTQYTGAELAALGIATSFDVASNTAADTSNPELTAISLPSVDVTSGGETVPFSVGALDAGSGVDRVILSFDHSWQDQSGPESVVSLTDLTDSFADGRSATSVHFDPATPAGTYTVTSAVVFDKAGNSTQYSPADLASMGLPTSFTVADRNVAPTAYVSAPAVVVEGRDTSAALSLTLLDVGQWAGSVSLSFSAAGSTASQGVDVLVPNYSATFSISQSTPANYVIALPSIGILDDLSHDGVETLAITVHASGQVFATGTDTTTVVIRIIDGEEAHNDFNGDGRSDVLWRSDDGTLHD